MKVEEVNAVNVVMKWIKLLGATRLHQRKRNVFIILYAMFAVVANAQVQQDCAKLVYGVPGQRFVQKIRTTDAGAQVAVEGLPEGLLWNAGRQMVDGVVAQEGEYHYYVRMNGAVDTVTLHVKNDLPQKTPFMGLLTWNVFEGDISDTLVRQVADAMVDLGLAQVGYRYLCLDDLWAEAERENRHLVWNRQKFPNGPQAMVDYVHAKGLKLGIYSDAGSRTCSGGQPGSLGFEAEDAGDFVSAWGMDLLKYDFCNNDRTDRAGAFDAYSAMSAQLAKSLGAAGKGDFVYYLCEWGGREPWKWGAEAGGTCWRATADTRDCWENPTYKGGVLDNIKIMTKIWQYNGINRFNDADMMMCGLHGKGKSSNAGTDGQGMSQSEYRTQMVLWCMWGSPLTLCFDVTTLYDGQSRIDAGLYNPYYKSDLALITNADLIAIDQDPLAQAAEPLVFDDDWLVLMKDLYGGDVAVSATNMHDEPALLELSLKDIPTLDPNKHYMSTELLSGDVENKLSPARDRFVVMLPAHGTMVWRFSEQK